MSIQETDQGMEQAEVVSMLKQRGIDNVERELQNCSIEGALGAIRWWDEQKRVRAFVGTGLLVLALRDGGKPGYGEIQEASLRVTPRLLASVRGRCLSPDGAWRNEVLDMFEAAAKKRGLTADELVDQAMGPAWTVTPPHPALLSGPDQGGRYERWVGQDEPERPDVSVRRRAGESVTEFSARFWRQEGR